MTKQAKSDDEIVNETIGSLFNKSKDSKDIFVRQSVIYAYKHGQKELLPIINQQAEEIEKLRGQGITTLNDYREEVKMRLDAQTERDNLLQENEKLKAVHENDEQSIRALGNSYDKLKSRFDELLKSLEDEIELAGSQNTLAGSLRLVKSERVQSLISKAKGQENGKV